MKIAFVQFLYYEYLGIMYLSSCLKEQGHTVDVFIYTGRGGTGKFVDEVERFRPDIAAFSIMSGSEGTALSLAREVKKRLNVYSVFGGPHPTVVPEIVENEGVDCVCLGESERSLTAVVDALAEGRIPRDVPGAWFKINGQIVQNDMDVLVQDLESLPRPDRSLYRAKYKALPAARAVFITGRGCPYQCTFCSNPALMELYRGKGTYLRRRPVPDVIDEIREVKAAYHIRSAYFEDDTFILNRDWVLEFCDAYQREIGLPFSCHIRADLATDELIAALARANCTKVSFGIETGNIRTRRMFLNKIVTDEQIIDCAALLKKHGIRSRTLNILGLPGETLDEAFQTVALNARIKPDFPWCSLYQPLPRTELEEYCRTHELFEEGPARSQPSFFQDSPLALKDKNEIVNLQKLFFYAVRFPALQTIIRRAIKSKPNGFFRLLFALGEAWAFLRSERITLREVYHIGIMNIGRYLPNEAERDHGSDRRDDSNRMP